MLDVIIGVKDPEAWHKENLRKNPKHYSSVRYLGVHSIVKVEECGLGHVYYNRHEMGSKVFRRPVKYGVISLSSLNRDLRTWDSLYVAGRLQKPVRLLKADEATIALMNRNLQSAVLAVLPLLPFTFTDRQLFLAITGLSYSGDIRTWFAENPHKVENIVAGNYDFFRQLYKPIIAQCPFIHLEEDKADSEAVYKQVEVACKVDGRMYRSNRLLISHHACHPPFTRRFVNNWSFQSMWSMWKAFRRQLSTMCIIAVCRRCLTR
ncbi:hypothetical protein WA538_000664 [Blastocystis sp. DL]